MIEPTPGRVLWYRPKAGEVGEAGLTPDGNKPLAAHIAFVHSPSLINIMLIDARGTPHRRENVQLVEQGELPEGACTWMPYQKGQAAKAEQLEQKLAEKPVEPVPVPAPAPAPAPVVEQQPVPAPQPQPEPQPQASALDQLAQPQG